MLDLDELVEAISAAVAGDEPALCIRVDDHPGGGVGISARSGVEDLLGWRAPAACRAVGVVAGGWATRLSDDGPSGCPDWTGRPGSEHRASCRVTCVVDRTGRISARTEIEGRVLGEAPTAGRLIDCMLRCFGLATPPPEVPATQMLTMRWLAEIIDASTLAGRKLRWDEVVRLHPVTQALAAAGLPGHAACFDGVPAPVARCWTWGRIRRHCTQGDWVHPGIDRSLASWMDDGMFARWVLAGMRSRGELLREAARCVRESCADRLRTAAAGQIDTLSA